MGRPHGQRLRRAAAVAAATLTAAALIFLTLCYACRFDRCAAVTVFPVWVWPVPGVLLALPAAAVAGRRAVGVAVLAWGLFLVAFADEPLGLVRTLWREWPSRAWVDAPEDRSLRVVSINCVGRPEAAAEVVPLEPDIVLVQEAPPRAALERLSARLYGDGAVLLGADPAIVADGSVVPLGTDGRWSVAARVELASGVSLRVVCVHLLPPSVRVDLWSPACWSEQMAQRRTRREQLRRALRKARAGPASLPLLVGGDFNAPAGDAIYETLRPGLRDAYEEAGVGFCNTVVSGFPFHRIDQVWVGERFRVASLVTRPTRHSDHRMVICDLLVREP